MKQNLSDSHHILVTLESIDIHNGPYAVSSLKPS